ncbi:unnamed protein product, partial [Ixodes pacificus]
RWFSIYQITHIGGVLTWIGMMASTFAPTLPWMVITFGLIYGTGLGIFTVSLGIITMMYFDQYRGIASGIIFAGFSLSSLIFARVLVIIQEVYGFRSIFL